MQMSFSLELPRDVLSVPMMRGVISASLRSVGTDSECISDISVAITEACTNVIDHSADGDEYEVIARVIDDVCQIEVKDTGRGFDADSLGRSDALPTAESGRGIQLMRALVDRVAFQSVPEEGMIVHLEKRLHLVPESPMQQLMDSVASDAGS